MLQLRLNNNHNVAQLVKAIIVFFAGCISIACADELPQVVECIHYPSQMQNLTVAKYSRVDTDLLTELEGKKIHYVSFKSIDVFDAENNAENNKLYLFVNKLHATTRQNVVESQLLFKIGDVLNADAIHESERILRSRKYFTNAYIVPESVCGDNVNLLVVTQDAWALEPQFSFSHKSGDSQTGFGVSDGNILGTGNALSISYSENNLRNGVNYEFSNAHFLNKQIAFHVSYEDTNDGRNTLMDISRPFYALTTPWATGLHTEDLSLIEPIRERGEIVNQFRHQTLLNDVFFGKATSINSDYTTRWLLGFTEEQQYFYSIPTTFKGLPVDDKIVYPWLEYQYIENEFGVFKNVNQIQRAEDIALGKTISFRVGYGGKSIGNPDDVIRYKGSYSHSIEVNEKHIFEYQIKINGHQHLQINDLDPAILGGYMSYNYFQNEKNRWYSRISYDVGQNLAQYEELTVGDLTGLRGYPTDYVRGKKRYVFTLERRYFSDVHIFNLLRVGAVVFFDMGKAWGLQDPYAPLLSDVGIGLRFSSTKIRVGNVIHVDLGMPTSAKSGISQYQLMIGAEQKF